jgi:hypothetical protein
MKPEKDKKQLDKQKIQAVFFLKMGMLMGKNRLGQLALLKIGFGNKNVLEESERKGILSQ